jgi:hypothetical protein
MRPNGTPTQRALRMVGVLAPHSPLSALLHGGGLVGGLVAGGVGTAGSLGNNRDGVSRLDDAKGQRNHLSNLIRSGGMRTARLRTGRASAVDGGFARPRGQCRAARAVAVWCRRRVHAVKEGLA